MPRPVPWVRAMRRREFIGALSSAAAWPIAARAQQPDRLRRIGVLIRFAESDPAVQSWLAAFRGALAKLRWTEGSNLRMENRWAGSDPDRMKTFAKELIDLRPDAILSVTTPGSSCPRDADNSHRDRERSRSDRQWLCH